MGISAPFHTSDAELLQFEPGGIRLPSALGLSDGISRSGTITVVRGSDPLPMQGYRDKLRPRLLCRYLPLTMAR